MTVVVVGAGPAGLSAAIELRRLGADPVVVADREAAPGGVPRHSFHAGYGLRDLRRVMTGPSYARALAEAAEAAGARLRTGATVTGLACGPARLEVTITSAAGIETVPAAAVLLATGCRERPRAARLVPGDRPAGVMTTGELQQRVYLDGERRPGRALVVGAEHVSFSASAAGVFAAGNLVHAAETADIAALSGRHAARQIAAFLSAVPVPGGPVPGGTGRDRRPVLAEPPLRWVSPNAIGTAPPPLGRFVLRSGEFRRAARLEARQDGRLLTRTRPVRLIPGRPVHLGAGWLDRVDPAGGPVHVVTGG